MKLRFNASQVRILREGLGLTQGEMGERIGVSKQAVSWWESGQSEPSIENLLKLVNVTGAKLESFFVPIVKTDQSVGRKAG